MITRTDGATDDMPNVRTFLQDAAIAAMQGLLATQIGPSVTFTAVSLAKQLEAEMAKESK